MSRRSTLTLLTAGLAAAAWTVTAALAPPAQAAFTPISGAGSTWASNAIQQWSFDLAPRALTVQFQANGSTQGRTLFRNSTVDFAVTDAPYGLSDRGLTDVPATRPHAYVAGPAGAVSLMYNLTVGGTRITSLRLSPATVAGIFTGTIKRWDDPAVVADNRGLTLPRTPILPVVRSDQAGTTLHLTGWLNAVAHDQWQAYCAAASRPTPCGATSFYPVLAGSGFTAQNGSVGVAGFTASATSDGAITYVEDSYAVNARFPTAKLLNPGGFYTTPTTVASSLALLGEDVAADPEAPGFPASVFGGVWSNPDPRAYPLAFHSYLVVPTTLDAPMTLKKGNALAEFGRYAVCDGQLLAPDLGYARLPAPQVQAALARLAGVPGADVPTLGIAGCANPALNPDGSDALSASVPQPQPCDAFGQPVCGTTPDPTPDPTPTPTPTPTQCDDHGGHGEHGDRGHGRTSDDRGDRRGRGGHERACEQEEHEHRDRPDVFGQAPGPWAGRRH